MGYAREEAQLVVLVVVSTSMGGGAIKGFIRMVATDL